ncbi:interferon alpha-F-like [Brienomyrus brachyistius]|uniref:interferon alpha-F-like n=1 Tax=Brienomyrus brachyistius TaxID=42636 RepID=UPI0020B1FA95|nr:interferon alpha-F-like [Brienomyrus brachyistius]
MTPFRMEIPETETLSRKMIWPDVNQELHSRCMPANEQKHYITQSLHNLKSMGPRLPSECSAEAMSIRIKKRPKIVRQVSFEQAIRLSSELFSEDLHLVKWNQSSLENLQQLLGRQKVMYSHCLKNSTLKKTKRKTKTMEYYFKNLRDFLSKENHSLCAWEVVRAEIQSIFEKFRRNSEFNVNVKNRRND